MVFGRNGVSPLNFCRPYAYGFLWVTIILAYTWTTANVTIPVHVLQEKFEMQHQYTIIYSIATQELESQTTCFLA